MLLGYLMRNIVRDKEDFMEHDKNISYLIDYIHSFDLLYSKTELSDDTTLLSKIMDENYKKYTLDYVGYLTRYVDGIEFFVTKEYNLLWLIWRFFASVSTFEEYTELLETLTRSDLETILKEHFNLKDDKSLDSLMIDKMELSPESKWQLCVLLEDLENKIKKLVMYLKKQYIFYCETADKIYEEYQEKIHALDKRVESPENLYQLMFENLLDKERYDKIDQFIVLLISSHAIFVHYTPSCKMIALGCYVYDYYIEKETQKQLNNIKCQNVLKILSDPTRYRMMKCISKGLTGNKQIAELFGITPAGVTYQMKLMAEHELIYIDDIKKQYVLNSGLITAALRTVLVDLEL